MHVDKSDLLVSQELLFLEFIERRKEQKSSPYWSIQCLSVLIFGFCLNLSSLTLVQMLH